MPNNDLVIRLAKKEDLAEMQELFAETISAVCAKDYDAAQIKAWISSVENTGRWLDKMTRQHFLIAEITERIVGYASLEAGNYFDFLYVHKDFQKQGIAQSLLQKIEVEAKNHGAITIDSDVSITAKPFFEKNGYMVIRTNTNILNGVKIVNYRMAKHI